MNRSWRILVIATFLVLVVLVPAAATFYTDWLWFGETGYQDVFVRTLTAQGTLGAAAALVAFGVLLFNVRIAIRAVSPRQLMITTREGLLAITVDRRRLQLIGTAVAGGLALLFGLFAWSQWQEWLLFRHAQPFGKVDPILGKDIGFYLFQLPFLETLQGYVFALVVLGALIAGAVYVVAGALSWDPSRGVQLTPPVRRHLAVLAAALLVVLAFGAYLDVPRLLTTPAGIIHGATNVDVAVRLPALRIVMVAALLGAGLALYQTVSRSWWPLMSAAALYIGVTAASSAGAALMQRFVVTPNEQVRETPFIEHNITATRQAFALDNVDPG